MQFCPLISKFIVSAGTFESYCLILESLYIRVEEKSIEKYAQFHEKHTFLSLQINHEPISWYIRYSRPADIAIFCLHFDQNVDVTLAEDPLLCNVSQLL